MNRPLVISDCDEVLLHMVAPFGEWLDEAHGIHFDMAGGGFAKARKRRQYGRPGPLGPPTAPATPTRHPARLT